MFKFNDIDTSITSMTLNLMSSLFTLTEHSPARLQEELDLLGQTIGAM